MPAAAWLAPAPAALRSKTWTDAPRCANRHATPRPITPPPMTAMLALLALDAGWVGKRRLPSLE
jgi:hypothetical protein